MAAAAPAAIAAVGSIIGGITGGKGAKKAAKISAQATREQIAAANANRDYQYSLNAPSITRGGAADDRISALLNLGGDTEAARAGFDAYRGSTGYDFRLTEGLDAINQRGFAGGAGMSGATLKAGVRFGQDTASNEFLRYLQELGGVSSSGAQARGLVAGVGSTSTGQLINASQIGAQQQIGAVNAGTANTQSLIQNLINSGNYALGSSYSKSPSSAAASYIPQGWQGGY
jgi:hypothetical protein